MKTANPDPTIEAALGRATMARVTRRLLPMLMLCYFVAYLDRVNIGAIQKELVRQGARIR